MNLAKFLTPNSGLLRPHRLTAVGGPGCRHAGFTILEAAVASTLLVLFLTSLFALNSTVMRMLRSANETANASQELQCRVEQIRLADWASITNPTSVSTWFKDQTDATLDLPDIVETLAAAPYTCDATTQAPAFKLQRNSDATVVTANDGTVVTGADLADPNVTMVRFDVTVTWRSWGGRNRTRALTTVVSRWGVSK